MMKIYTFLKVENNFYLNLNDCGNKCEFTKDFKIGQIQRKKESLTSQTCMTCVMWNCSTVVEHSTRIPMIEGSNPASGT